MHLERSTELDWPAIEELLVAGGLPLDGAREAFATGLVGRDAGRLVAAAAIEPHGASGLLRSVVVDDARRGEGLGRTIVAASEARARELGIGELYLLTETAAAWFPRLGYEAIDRSQVPAALTSSVEFTTTCPTSAIAMRRTLR